MQVDNLHIGGAGNGTLTEKKEDSYANDRGKAFPTTYAGARRGQRYGLFL